MFKQYLDTPYDIYDDGRCYSHLSNKFLTPKMSAKYPSYHLTINGQKRDIKVHRMVAEAFIKKPDETKNIVNHIDGDTHNFHVSNLEWVTAAENTQHAIKTGLRKNGSQVINKFTANLPNETWVPVKGFLNYVVSSCGRVMNVNTKRLIKAYEDNAGGYYCVNLWENGYNKLTRIHTLVYSNFNNDYELTGYVINHIDGDKHNNNVENLEKITYRENNLHAIYTIKTNNCAKAVNQLNDKHEIIATFNSIAEATRITNIANISRAIKKEGRAGGYYWEFQK